MDKKITSYKGFDKDLKCRGYQYKIGESYTHDGNPSVCNSGFHACENPLDVLDYYNDIDGKYCVVEQSGKIEKEDRKIASSEIKIKAEIGFVGLFNAGIEYLKEITKPQNNIADYAQIGSSGYSAQIGSSGDDCVICCAGHYSVVKAKKGSWITLSEWKYDKSKKRMIPKCVKTEYVDGERIKADTWYKLINGEFTEQ